MMANSFFDACLLLWGKYLKGSGSVFWFLFYFFIFSLFS